MKMKNRLQGRADINAGNYHTNVFQENDKSDKSISLIYLVPLPSYLYKKRK